MKGIKSSVRAIILIIAIPVLVMGCKKETSPKFIDELLGTYIAYDTTTVTGPVGSCPPGSAGSFAMVITKVNETTIDISELSSCDGGTASVTGTNITLITTSCPSISLSFDPMVSKSGTNLNFTYSASMGPCSVAGNIKAVKQ